VAPPKKKKSVAAHTKAKAPTVVKVAAQMKANAPKVAKVLQHKAPPKKQKVPSPPTRTSQRRAKAPFSMDTQHDETFFHSILNNPFPK
jgi:hypothetical protein